MGNLRKEIEAVVKGGVGSGRKGHTTTGYGKKIESIEELRAKVERERLGNLGLKRIYDKKHEGKEKIMQEEKTRIQAGMTPKDSAKKRDDELGALETEMNDELDRARRFNEESTIDEYERNRAKNVKPRRY